MEDGWSLHREDGPAIEYSNGSKRWCFNGKPHRTDGPAVELADGTKYWYVNGNRHRTDGPAIEHGDGSKSWYINNQVILPEENLIEIPETEDEMLEVFGQNKFVKIDGEYYFINQYIKKYKKDFYEKYLLLFVK